MMIAHAFSQIFDGAAQVQLIGEHDKRINVKKHEQIPAHTPEFNPLREELELRRREVYECKTELKEQNLEMTKHLNDTKTNFVNEINDLCKEMNLIIENQGAKKAVIFRQFQKAHREGAHLRRDKEYLIHQFADKEKMFNTITSAMQTVNDNITAELEIWKSQLTYIKDKHHELHQLELEWEKENPNHEDYQFHEQYDGIKFSNDVICVFEVAESKVKELKNDG